MATFSNLPEPHDRGPFLGVTIGTPGGFPPILAASTPRGKGFDTFVDWASGDCIGECDGIGEASYEFTWIGDGNDPTDAAKDSKIGELKAEALKKAKENAEWDCLGSRCMCQVSSEGYKTEVKKGESKWDKFRWRPTSAERHYYMEITVSCYVRGNCALV